MRHEIGEHIATRSRCEEENITKGSKDVIRQVHVYGCLKIELYCTVRKGESGHGNVWQRCSS